MSIFDSLWRTLTGGRTTPDPTALSFEQDWAGILAELELPARALRDVVTAGSLHPPFRYRRFTRPKKDGGRREIAEPDPKLKRVQREILRRHLASEAPHPAAVAYQPGRSTADHVWAHAGAAVIVTADVRDFFPSTSAGRVEDWWRTRVDDDTARLFAILTTDRGGLPQGAPTSPALSNLVNAEMDGRLVRRAAAARARYTRYCDDLAFSWDVDIGPPSDFETAVRGILIEFGYRLHPTKGWRVYQRRDEPEVTGLVLTETGGVRLPDRLGRVMWDLGAGKNPGDEARLNGYRGYSVMVTRRPKRPRPAALPNAGVAAALPYREEPVGSALLADVPDENESDDWDAGDDPDDRPPV
jgi:RNA-directed DNA polymerase